MSDYTETAQVYQERKVNESCLERNRWSQNWFFSPNFSISLKVLILTYFYFENYIHIIHLEYPRYFPAAPISHLLSK